MGVLRLLPAGSKVLSLYADASFADEVAIGCWAYALPGLPVSGCGIESGCSVNRLEVAAVLHGLRAAVALDWTARPIQVHTDSEFVLRLMKHAMKCEPLPARRSYQPVADLYGEACRIAAHRQLLFRLRRARDPHHRDCDRRARELLCLYCRSDEFTKDLALHTAQARRLSLVKEIERTERSFQTLNAWLLQCDLQIGALRQTSSPPV